VKHWEIIADNLHKAGWSYGYVSALDCERRTIWIVDAHGYGKRFIVRADEMLSAFLGLEIGDSPRSLLAAAADAPWPKNYAVREPVLVRSWPWCWSHTQSSRSCLD
jgi:hypothetical protein